MHPLQGHWMWRRSNSFSKTRRTTSMLNSFTTTLKPAALQYLQNNTSWAELFFLKSSDSQQGKEAHRLWKDVPYFLSCKSHWLVHEDKTLTVIQYHSCFLQHKVCIRVADTCNIMLVCYIYSRIKNTTLSWPSATHHPLLLSSLVLIHLKSLSTAKLAAFTRSIKPSTLKSQLNLALTSTFIHCEEDVSVSRLGSTVTWRSGLTGNF